MENRYAYDAFGNLLGQEEAFPNRILYAGQLYDQETGQYYLRARYYNPTIGRFSQEDTYWGDGLNLYAYCANNPVRYFDPSGHQKKPNCPGTEGEAATDKQPGVEIESGSFSKGVGNPVEVVGRGSTGRTVPNTLNEQMAMHQVMSNPLEGAVDMSQLKNHPVIMSDSRWLASEGWVKMSNNVNGVEIHFVYNKITGAFDDFKFK